MPVGITQSSDGSRWDSALLRQWLLWHPEWWALLFSVLAWLFLLLSARQSSPDWAGMMCSATNVRPQANTGAWLSGLGHSLGHVAIMTVAMMLPLLVVPLRHVAFRSLWRRRVPALTMFLLGYLLVWVLAGVLPSLVLAAQAGRGAPISPVITLALFVIAAAWQIAPARQRALRICHRTVPLAPTGWRADWACLRYGWFNGRHCLLACWAMMLAASLAPAHLLTMMGVSAISMAERYYPRLSTQSSAGLLLVSGAGLALLPWWSGI